MAARKAENDNYYDYLESINNFLPLVDIVHSDLRLQFGLITITQFEKLQKYIEQEPTNTIYIVRDLVIPSKYKDLKNTPLNNICQIMDAIDIAFSNVSRSENNLASKTVINKIIQKYHKYYPPKK